MPQKHPQKLDNRSYAAMAENQNGDGANTVAEGGAELVDEAPGARW
jgi:hypothetical protein